MSRLLSIIFVSILCLAGICSPALAWNSLEPAPEDPRYVEILRPKAVIAESGTDVEAVLIDRDEPDPLFVFRRRGAKSFTVGVTKVRATGGLAHRYDRKTCYADKDGKCSLKLLGDTDFDFSGENDYSLHITARDGAGRVIYPYGIARLQFKRTYRFSFFGDNMAELMESARSTSSPGDCEAIRAAIIFPRKICGYRVGGGEMCFAAPLEEALRRGRISQRDHDGLAGVIDNACQFGGTVTRTVDMYAVDAQRLRLSFRESYNRDDSGLVKLGDLELLPIENPLREGAARWRHLGAY